MRCVPLRASMMDHLFALGPLKYQSLDVNNRNAYPLYCINSFGRTQGIVAHPTIHDLPVVNWISTVNRAMASSSFFLCIRFHKHLSDVFCPFIHSSRRWRLIMTCNTSKMFIGGLNWETTDREQNTSPCNSRTSIH